MDVVERQPVSLYFSREFGGEEVAQMDMARFGKMFVELMTQATPGAKH